MKQMRSRTALLALTMALVTPVALLAQQDEKTKKENEQMKVEKAAKDKKETEQIIITRSGDSKDKTVIEINGDKIMVNGKPLDEKDGEVNVQRFKFKDANGLNTRMGMAYAPNANRLKMLSEADANRAMLGVTTEKAEGGVEVQDVTDESAAEKAGIKENDVITKIDDKKIEDPDDLSAAIKAHKPGDKVTVTYLRDKKEQKTSAELTKWKGMSGSMSLFGPEGNLNLDLGDMNLRELSVPRVAMPRVPGQPYAELAPGQNFNWSWSGSGPKLGLSVQDSEDGKGVKVIDVDEDSNAGKAGVKEDDLITEVNGKAVNGADEIAKIVKENKDKISIQLKIQRDGKTQNIEVKMPRKIKTADL